MTVPLPREREPRGDDGDARPPVALGDFNKAREPVLEREHPPRGLPRALGIDVRIALGEDDDEFARAQQLDGAARRSLEVAERLFGRKGGAAAGPARRGERARTECDGPTHRRAQALHQRSHEPALDPVEADEDVYVAPEMLLEDRPVEFMMEVPRHDQHRPRGRDVLEPLDAFADAAPGQEAAGIQA